jgi:hypothetical protein
VQCPEIHLEQHRHYHQPNQQGDWNVDLGHGHAAEPLKRGRKKLTEDDAGNDAKRHPDSQITFEGAERRCRCAASGLTDVIAVPLSG